MELIALSIGRNILIPGSRDRLRMERYAQHLAELHVIVLTRKSHGFGEFQHEGNLHLYPTNSRTRLSMLVTAFRIAYRILNQTHAPLTITAQDPLELGLLAYLLSRCTSTPYTVQVHGDYLSEYWTEGSLIRRARRAVLPFVLKYAVRVRVVSERIKLSLLRIHIPESKIVVLPIRPELEMFKAAGASKVKWNTFTVLTASRLAPEKNIPLLIRAFKRLHDRYPTVRLRIAGEGSEHARIKHEIDVCKLHDAVSLLPWVQNLADEMAKAHVFALASQHEAYGLVLIEALAAGTPVVTTDVGCVGEVVQPEKQGIAVPVGDESAFGDALIRMFEDVAFRERAVIASQVCVETLLTQSEDAYTKQWVALHSA